MGYIQHPIKNPGRRFTAMCIVVVAMLLPGKPALAQFHQNLSFRAFNNNVVDCNTMASTFESRTAYTVEARVKFNLFTLWGNVFAKRSGQVARDIVLQSYSTNGTIGVAVENGYGYSSTALVPGAWYHLAVVYDGSATGDSARLKLYINGVQDSLTFLGTNVVPAVSPAATGSRFAIGAEYSGTTPITGSSFLMVPFDGAVDELRIWDIARTQSDIQADMNAELTVPRPNLTAYYQFNQGSACGANAGLTSVPDLAGTNNGTLWNFLLSGTLSNYTTVVDTSVTLNGSTLTSNASPATYQWFDCNSNSILVGQTASSYTTAWNGNVAVIVTQDFCIDTSACILGVINSLDWELRDEVGFVYPNPSDGNFSIRLPEPGGEIVILDVSGKEVLRKMVTESSMEVKIETNGIYLVRIQTSKGAITQRLVISR